ncbi:hypothetical protein N6H18_07200 [Reichenbachiella agarivorans]|uniref:Outer membrane protein beta-barrel domain-containing protein n=1 Tax=Reichenbachiella agarivorans TaxID=2979464 RepID=A0ABY6CTB8_9BACT|nr:hypothetical protein [Reichenbachiella agarivorans]UXP33738.1 hypothetical protein N6H18_07200 [Reichenbachiella agarivorans]
MKGIVVTVLVSMFSICAMAQTDGNYEYSKEIIWGINKNTNGGLIGGFMLRWSSARSEKKFRNIGIELMNVKDPHENRISNGQSQFIYGKSHYLYAIRAQYGFDHLLFKKAPDRGVQINFNYSLGPTIGVIAPYYLQDFDGNSHPFSYEQFPTWTSVARTGFLFQGLGESSLTVGVNARAGLLFEMGAFKSNVTGFEIGALVEGFAQKIELMPNEEDKALFVSAYITIFYGRRK